MWVTPTWRFLGAADGTLFAREAAPSELDAEVDGLPRIDDERVDDAAC